MLPLPPLLLLLLLSCCPAAAATAAACCLHLWHRLPDWLIFAESAGYAAVHQDTKGKQVRRQLCDNSRIKPVVTPYLLPKVLLGDTPHLHDWHPRMCMVQGLAATSPCMMLN
jgi:hypothetical protein